VLGALLDRTVAVVVNDIDPGVAALWRTVRDAPDELVRRVNGFTPTVGAFEDCKRLDGQPGGDVDVGFRKLALHQTSFSGLGARSGGPLGGKNQSGKDDVGSRWNPSRLANEIKECHRTSAWFPRFEVRNEDFAAVLARLTPRSFAYLDPPYYVQGPNLYKHAFAEDDHARLAACFKGAPYQLVLSYDDHPRVRELYSWATIESFSMTPSVRTARSPRRPRRELLVTPGSRRVGEIVRL
jgi:DNA adenine methylase